MILSVWGGILAIQLGVLGKEVVVLTHGGCLELPDSLRQGGFN